MSNHREYSVEILVILISQTYYVLLRKQAGKMGHPVEVQRWMLSDKSTLQTCGSQ